MKSKKKHTNQDFEVVDGIGKYMDDDIQWNDKVSAVLEVYLQA